MVSLTHMVRAPVVQSRTAWLAAVLFVSCVASGCGTSPGRIPMGAVDVPRSGQALSGHFSAVGWAVSEDRIKRVSVFLDRSLLKDCSIGGSRPDVSKVYPGFPEGDNAGWTVDLDAGSLPEGKHELVFQAESAKGARRDLGTVTVIIMH